jgi:hypothetical protein
VSRLANALGDLTGEGEVREVMSENEAIVKCFAYVSSAVAIILVTAIGGCTMFNRNEQMVRLEAVSKGMAPTVQIDGKTYVRPECLFVGETNHGSTYK